ncbi:MAG TPA: hypothetical protein ENH97_03865 [bacterium]|nr:hypothetical protein [bacterium]
MAVDIKKVLTSLKERKETMLVWGLGVAALCLGIFLLIGYLRGPPPPPSQEVIVRGKKPLKSKEEIEKEAIAELKESQKISPFVDYQDILGKNLFIQSRLDRIEGARIAIVGGFILKGILDYGMGNIKAVINDPAGKPHLVGVGQRIGASEVKVVAIDFKNQSVTLMGKGWEKPQVSSMAKEKIDEKEGLITYKPREEKREIEKPKEAPEKSGETPEEEPKKAITEAKKTLSEASDVILTARSEGVDTDEAEARRDDAKVKLEDAQEAMKEEDYKRAEESAKGAQALAQEAVQLVKEALGKEEEEYLEEEEGE